MDVRAAEIEKYLKEYRDRLREFTEGSNPVEWAEIQMNLGRTFMFRLSGERKENVRKAIKGLRGRPAHL